MLIIHRCINTVRDSHRVGAMVSPARQRDNDSHYETETIFVLILISKTQTK